MGGADAVMKKAQASFDRGDYRWVAEVLNYLVFAQPENTVARALLARTYEQMGYRSESGVWRDEYLTAALELRQGPTKKGIDTAAAQELLRRTPIPRFFDSMAVRLDGPKAEGRDTVVNVEFTDIGESYVLFLENAVLHHRKGPPDSRADATIRLTHDLFVRMLTGQAGIKETLLSDDLETSGNRVELVRFLTLFDKPDGTFPIVTP
jgi:alkyl sulfatase BDS1-like metallo-beta-lactamase superfamily hydrolase